MKRKTWKFGLALVMLIALLALGTLAASAETEGYYTYEVSNGEATITDVNDAISGDIEIPSTLGGYPVTALSIWAFEGCTDITGITLPNSIKEIDGQSFDSCKNLIYNTYDNANYLGTSENPYYALIRTTSTGISSCDIHSDTQIIAVSAFQDCSSLTSLAIPSGVIGINEAAFRYCLNITSIFVPSSVTHIGPGIFQGCFELTTIEIDPKNTVYHEAGNCVIETATGTVVAGCDYSVIPMDGSIKILGDKAFSFCHNLKSIAIPRSVTKIGQEVFYCCTSLESISVEEGNTVYHSNENCVIETATNTLIIGIADSVIPTEGSVTSIGDFAFSGCCNKPTAITIPSSVTRIGEMAFYNCQGLTEVLFAPNSQLTSIGWGAFFFCENLQKIAIPSSVTKIESDAFYGCYNLSFNVYDNIQYLGNEQNPYFALIQPLSSTTTTYETHPNTKLIADGAFMYHNITELTVSDSVTYIGECAFFWCTSLMSVTFGENSQLTSIGNYAFSRCSSLTSINIPESVTGIGNYAFEGCSSLTSINIPEGVTSIGEWAFSNCSSLTSINIPEGVTSIGNRAFFCCSSMTSINIPESVTSIGDWAFMGCSSMTSINIPESVTSIGDWAFYNCRSLASITFLSPNTEIYDSSSTIHSTATIRGYEGSTAQAYAEKYGRTFELIEDEEEVMYGDANGDGSVNGQDLLLLRKYLANYDYTTNTSTIEVDFGADANGDGVINGQDLLLLRKYLANYDYTTGQSSIVLGPSEEE